MKPDTHYPTFDELMAQRTQARYREACRRAQDVLRLLRARHIGVQVCGSLVRGPTSPDRPFHRASDVDFLITSLPDPSLRYGIETDVELAMGDLPFDVVYADEVRPGPLKDALMREARDETPLC